MRTATSAVNRVTFTVVQGARTIQTFLAINLTRKGAITMNDVFVAFWGGMAGGTVLGIVIAAIMAAVSNSIEKGDQE